jgi:hypothetical protein
VILRPVPASVFCGALLSLTLGAGESVDFVRDIRPILSENCAFCHGPDAATREADLRLDTPQGIATVVDGEGSDDSELFLRLISQDDDARMPPPDSNRNLSESQIELMRRWIDEGARWDQHWSFRPLVRPDTEALADGDRSKIRNPIDRFVQHQLSQRSIASAPEAPRSTLIRRLSLDLTGLPPSPEDVQRFISDKRPDAYEQLVERLLASPAYGQRMAWDWLDAARYADTNGYQGDRERTMWPWRDWVVNAFNENMPLDQFTIWQLAGDLLPEATDQQKLATGFCRNHMINGEGGRIAEENRVEYVMDMSETMGTVWLGLTLNCCRCHDHKYDPISNREYYQFFAFFNQTPVTGGGGDPQTAPLLATPSEEQTQRLTSINDQIASADEELQRLPSDVDSQSARRPLQERRDSLVERRSAIEKSLPKVMVMADMATPRKTLMLERGLYNKPTEEVVAALPAFLPAPPDGASANRLTLARWLVSDANPLTPRVTVNRFWQQVFGIGLVKTTEDFGSQGEIPIHLDLLNWLAAEFRDSGWNVKHLLRLIVTSHTYRQSSKITDPKTLERDRDNRLLARGARYRMPAWMLRDQALAISGLLSSIDGGPAVNSYQPAGVWEEASFGKKTYKQDSGEKLYRRSLYTFWRRIIAPTMFFDNASRQTCTVRAGRTNTPLHALATLNDVVYVEAARTLAERVLTSAAISDRKKIDLVLYHAVARQATEPESSVLLAGLVRTRRQFAQSPRDATLLISAGESPTDESLDAIEHASWTALCLAVLNLDETLTRE